MIEWLHNAMHPLDLDGMIVLLMLGWGVVHDRIRHHRREK